VVDQLTQQNAVFPRVFFFGGIEYFNHAPSNLRGRGKPGIIGDIVPSAGGEDTGPISGYQLVCPADDAKGLDGFVGDIDSILFGGGDELCHKGI